MYEWYQGVQLGDIIYYDQERFVVIKITEKNRIHLKRSFHKRPAVLKIEGNDMYICLTAGRFTYVDPFDIAYLCKKDDTYYGEGLDSPHQE